MAAKSSLTTLVQALKKTGPLSKRLSILELYPAISSYLNEHPAAQKVIKRQNAQARYIFFQCMAIGQVPQELWTLSDEALRRLVLELIDVDTFYYELGGIAGYQDTILQLLGSPVHDQGGQETFHPPHFTDISLRTSQIDEMIDSGIESLPLLGEIYPIGGAADRLHLIDEQSKESLPAAKLCFCRRTLLEWLIRDLEAREHLYFLRTGKKIVTPIAMMTSQEKDNHRHIEEILRESNWFHRPKESFRLFRQPLVPVVDERGSWVWKAPGTLALKPGGHGAIWKLAQDQQVFEWFKSFGVRYLLIRQINNPVAGVDYGLLAFSGLGAKNDKDFGFASCPRLCSSAEGMNVLVEKNVGDGYLCRLSNVEYTDFQKRGIEDLPIHPENNYSRFSSNTNILFAKIEALEEAVKKCPYPGLILNMSKKEAGRRVGRLESAMQNIADVFVETRDKAWIEEEKPLVKTFITYNHRHKTISTAKKAFVAGSSLHETPEKCFYDLMHAYRELLEQECGFVLPQDEGMSEVSHIAPPFVFLYHPALGPDFMRIAQKIRGGRLSKGSEWELDLANVDIARIDIDGSALFLADAPKSANLVLHDVKIVNRGVDWSASQPAWKGVYQRAEAFEVIFRGEGRFIAKNVTFEGAMRIEIPDGEEVVVSQDQRGLSILRRPLGYIYRS